MKFEWDEEKNRLNKRDHKVSFEEARGTIKNYSDKFSIEEKVLMTIKAYLAEGEIKNKEALRQEVDALLV